ncbi:Pfs, NACHT and ankyrin domain-containing protein [Pochonia chlamydosporia 170]|uniref:Pfs, NACHT and ankyrin domain-containing protein n=1 Tax=Pochonia chlamydosporia 170 TaxID=1380566 RepID=A0A179F744_METCM|nr:Pfs, NACHT and ankyrin domain-containing protein [Pochonia chlamydosporia 170]OAQ61284.1 Pfs, NACHT and ankyrin domain-containing protein [Pochonia chlamydosporia 170]
MSLNDLPIELTLLVASHLSKAGDISRFSRVCRRFHTQLTPRLYRDGGDSTCLYWAARSNIPGTLERAAQAGTDIKDFGSVLLRIAIDYGSELVFQRLIDDYQADPKTCDFYDGRTPLTAAVRGQQVWAVKKILESGADPSGQAGNIYAHGTPLHLAAKNGHMEISRLLVDAGADLSIEDGRRRTPLYIALTEGHVKMASLFLDHGADPATLDSAGRTALETALWAGCRVDMIKMLLQRGLLDILKTARRAAVMDRVFRDGKPELTELFLEKAADAKCNVGHEFSLIAAARNGRTEIVKLLLLRGVAVDARANTERTALDYALTTFHFDTAKLLIEEGAELCCMGKLSQGPLRNSIVKDHVELVRMLLARGADMHTPNEQGQTPLADAVLCRSIKVTRLLLEHGANINDISAGQPLLSTAAMGEDFATVSLLLDFGADPSDFDEDLCTPLHIAVEKENFDIAKLLLDHGANPSAVDHNGVTPLFGAAQDGSFDIVKDLLERGADACVVCANGWTPILKAASRGHLDVVNHLVQNGADLEKANNYGYTPLLAASEYGHIEVLEKLLEKGADIKVCNAAGLSPIAIASKNGYSQIVERLLAVKGVDAIQLDLDGRSAFHHAVMRGHESVVKLLLDAGAISFTKDRWEATPLILAARNGHAAFLKLLLDMKGANIHETDVFGLSALQWAARCVEPAAMEVLLAYSRASGVGVTVEDVCEGEKVKFRPLTCFCDACGRCTTFGQETPAQVCRDCAMGDELVFLICSFCVERGAQCRSLDHSWTPYTCSGHEELSDDDLSEWGQDDYESEVESDDESAGEENEDEVS